MSPETENSRMEEQTRSLGARRERKGSLPDTPRPPTIPSGTVGQGASSCAAVTLRASKVVIEGKSEERRIDFSLKGLLGRGGMGMVFSARQASLDREIAIKLIKPDLEKNGYVRSKFASEAIVTGDLEHPNIIPVYELGHTRDGKLFYAMKQVKGSSWEGAIRDNTEAENMEILLKVCDAVAFAHSRGVVHRDLKPENVMLGDYGEVLVMDWGLAISVDERGKADKPLPGSKRAGTVTYMAPEMARCEVDRIGPRSDVYLLGGILYQIVTGLRPHHGKNAEECAWAARENVIQPTDKRGELVDIALKAMAAEPADRYESVKAFQQAIREYQSHLESIVLTESAEKHLEVARKSLQYSDYAQALFAFREAAKLWPGNKRAVRGIADASLAYAFRAYGKGDYELADSLLDRSIAAHRSLSDRIEQALLKRERMVQRLKAFAYSSTPFVWALTAILAVLYVWSLTKNTTWKYQAQAARQKVEFVQRRLDEELRKRKELEERLGISGGEGEVPSHEEEVGEPVALRGHAAEVRSVEFSPDGERAATASVDGTVKIWSLEDGTILKTLQGPSQVLWAGFSPDGSRLAMTGGEGMVEVRDAAEGRELSTMKGHEGAVLQAAFSSDGRRLVTAGEDGTARIWDPDNGWELAVLEGHEGAVLSAAFSPDGGRTATGGADGAVRVWDAEGGWEIAALEAHEGGVHSVSFSPDGRLLITAGEDGAAGIWNAESRERVTTLKGHEGAVLSAVFSPDGRWAATAGADGTLRAWDVETGAEAGRFQAGNAPLGSVRFSPDGALLGLAAGEEGLVVPRDFRNPSE